MRAYRPRHLAAALAVAACAGLPMGAAHPSTAVLDLSIEELMALRVTSVAKRDQRLSDAAAAVFVITADDIRRSGVTSLPEALRLAPGVIVGRINGGQWAISTRGFASRFANKLLVLVDGRSVYTPLFSGVFWDAQDLMLENIERIEVIRGPGASLWGANAVNGVINIITRSAAETTGSVVTALGGDVDRAIVEARHGGAVASGAHARAWVRAADRGNSPRAAEHDGVDEWQRVRGGVRFDHASGDTRSMVTAEVYRSRVEDATLLGALTPPYFTINRTPLDNRGAYVLGRWQRSLEGGAEVTAQAYLDYTDSRYLDGREQRTTLDVEFQHRFRIGGQHDVTWGAGYRTFADRFDNAPIFVVPEGRYHLATAFIQDEIALLDERLHVTLGTRVEHNSFTGVELQPNVRAAWTPSPSHTLWGAVSRAVRTPAIAIDRGEATLGVVPPRTPANPAPLPVELIALGDGETRSETLLAAELGWRARLAATLSIDAAVFSNRYRRLASQVPGNPTVVPAPIPHIVQPLFNRNEDAKRVNGGEIVFEWHPHTRARVKGGWSLLSGGDGPRRQASLRPSFDLADDLELDAWLRHVASLDNGGERIPGYTELDVRIGWHASRNIELALVGQNLLHAKHAEFRSDLLGTLPMQVPRAFYLKLRVSF